LAARNWNLSGRTSREFPRTPGVTGVSPSRRRFICLVRGADFGTSGSATRHGDRYRVRRARRSGDPRRARDKTRQCAVGTK